MSELRISFRFSMLNIAAAEGEVIDWRRIAVKLPGRTNKDCRKRWYNAVADGINKGQWTKVEDERLKRGVESHGQKKWPLIAEIVETRSADRRSYDSDTWSFELADGNQECAKRWQQSLDPELDHSDWTDSDNKLLLRVVEQVGRQWTLIQGLHFPGRSKNAIKNRYSVLTRKSQSHSLDGHASSSADVGQNLNGLDDNQHSSGEDNEYDDFDNMETDLSLVDFEGLDMDAAEAYIANRAVKASEARPNLSPDWRFNETVSLGADTPQGADQFTLFRSTAATTDLTLGGTDLDAQMPTPSSSSDAWRSCSHHGPMDVASPTANHGFSAAYVNPQGAERANIGPEMFNPPTAPAGSLPESGAFQGSSGKVHFTLTMNGPSVQTMQSLMEIAIQTHARFRVERE
ncbi:MAG: hypothetical protein Q9225_005659 [Loekoesia sp. 1 TL-2023]